MTKMHKSLVRYECIDGAHFFTSGDQMSKGLCVAHQNLEIAYQEVSQQLVSLLALNHGHETEMEPALPIEKFSDWLNGVQGLSTGVIRSIPAGVIEWSRKHEMAAYEDRHLAMTAP
jgi:hypothetical protein